MALPNGAHDGAAKFGEVSVDQSISQLRATFGSGGAARTA